MRDQIKKLSRILQENASAGWKLGKRFNNQIEQIHLVPLIASYLFTPHLIT